MARAGFATSRPRQAAIAENCSNCVFGASLCYATRCWPALSVLSAVEGIE